MGRYPILFWLLFAVAMAVYLTMVLWSLPHLRQMAGGLPAFDLRPTGYTPEEARALIRALAPSGADFYLNVQHWLDTAYPALMAAVLILAFAKLARGFWIWVLAIGALVAAACDYMENRAVAGMLRAGPDAVSDARANGASGWTLWKSASSTVVFLALAGLLARMCWQRLRRR